MIAQIATVEDRKSQLKNTVDSLVNQVDHVYVWCNYKDLFTYDSPKVIVEGGIDIGDAGKFYFENEGYILTCDDDLIYPADYVSTMTAACEYYGHPVSCHGRTFKQKIIKSYYNDPAYKYRCLDEVREDVAVQFAGTGVLCYHTDDCKISIDHFPYPNMADIFFSRYCAMNGIELKVIKHSAGWIKYQEVSDTIYERFKNADSLQTYYANW